MATTNLNLHPIGKVCGKQRHHDPQEATELARKQRAKAVWCDGCEAFHVVGGKPDGPSLLQDPEPFQTASDLKSYASQAEQRTNSKRGAQEVADKGKTA